MLTSAAGIGYLVTSYRTVLDSPHVFAAVLTILALSVLFDMLGAPGRAAHHGVADRGPARAQHRARRAGHHPPAPAPGLVF